MKKSAVALPLAVACSAAVPAHAHIFNFVFGMRGGAVVPPTDSTALGYGGLFYNHHTFNYDLDLYITGIALDDLLDTGPNGTPIHIYHAPRGQTGDIVLDPGLFGEFVQDGEGIRLTLDDIRIGGQQGAFTSSIFDNENALYDGHLYIQLYTTQYPDGEIRGQIPPLYKFLGNDGAADKVELDGPPGRIPAPAGVSLFAAACAGLAARRRR